MARLKKQRKRLCESLIKGNALRDNRGINHFLIYKPLIYFFLLWGFFNPHGIQSQDANYSQFELAPLHLNPGLTGSFDGNFRMLSTYREQWTSILGEQSYRDGYISIDHPFSINSKYDLGIGAHASFDRAGETRLRNHLYSLSTAITRHLDTDGENNNSVTLGISLGYLTRQIDTSMLRFPGPAFTVIPKKSNFHLSVGSTWSYGWNERSFVHLGIAIHHINRPNISLTGDETRLATRNNLHGKVELQISQRLSLVPSFMYAFQGPHDQFLFGTSGKIFTKSDNQSSYFQLGIYGMTTEIENQETQVNACIINANTRLKSILLGFSYDRFTDLGSDAFEFTLGYIME